jgi:hypothetical protein
VSNLTLAGSVIGIAVYVPLCISILRGKVKQNLATYLLWALLDYVAAASIFYQHGNYLLTAAFALGSTFAALSIIRSKNFQWTWFETMVASLVVACIIVWAASGAYVATIASTTAVVIAGIPTVVECYKKPWDNSFSTFFGFFVANVLGTIGGKEWSVIERLYPAVCTIYALLIVILIARKFWIKPELQSETA